MLYHLAASHYLNYEDGKFSKRKGIGVFGDEAERTQIPVEVWRYYLLANRPEKGDTVFSWRDFGCKNNDEILPNLGNLCNRALTFSYNSFGGNAPNFDLPANLTESDK
jgi:methionyl-tRNA synthetase